jgi:MFS family permease
MRLIWLKKQRMTVDEGSAEVGGRLSAFRALRHVNYRWYWASGIGTTGAQGMKQLVVAWLVLEETGSVGQLGLVIFLQGLPMTFISLFGGVLADRYDRRMLLVLSQFFSMVNLFLLGVLSLVGTIEIWHIYVSSVAFGATQSLSMPSRQAMIKSLVERGDLQNAVALNSMQQTSGRIVWPLLAGGLISLFGVGATLVVNASLFVVGIGPLFMMRGLTQVRGGKASSPLRALAEGLQYAWSTPVTSMVVTLAMAIGLFGMVLLFMGPAFAREEMGFSAAETGVFITFSGIGALLGNTVLIVLDVTNKGQLFFALCITLALAVIALALNPWYVAAFVLMGVFGLTTSGLTVLAYTIFQMYTPGHLLGRVTSLWSVGGGLGSISALPIGLIGELYGLRLALGASSLIFLAITIWVGVTKSALRSAPTERSVPVGGAFDGSSAHE